MEFSHRLDQFVDRVRDEATSPWSDDLGYRSPSQRKNRSAAGKRLDHDQPERLGPIDGEHQRCRPGKKLMLARMVYLAQIVDVVGGEQRLDPILPIAHVNRVYLRRYPQVEPGTARHVDSQVGALLRGDSAQESEIAAIALS